MKVSVKTISHNDPKEIELAAPLVTELRSKVAVVCYDIAPTDSHRVRLIYKGRVLEDDKILNEYGIIDGDIVHAVIRPLFQDNNNNTSATASTNTNPTSSSTTQQTDATTAASRASNGSRGMPQIPNIPGLNLEQVADNVFIGSMSLDLSDPNVDQSTLMNILSNAIGGPLTRNTIGAGNSSANNNSANGNSNNQNVPHSERVGSVSESNNNNNNNNASDSNSTRLSPAMRQLIGTLQSFLNSIVTILRDMQRDNADVTQLQTIFNLISSQVTLIGNIVSVINAPTSVNTPGVSHVPITNNPMTQPQYFYPPYPTPCIPPYGYYGYPAYAPMFPGTEPSTLPNQSNPSNNAPLPFPQFQTQTPYFLWPPAPTQATPFSYNPNARVFEPNTVSSRQVPPTSPSFSPGINATPVASIPMVNVVEVNAANNNNNNYQQQNPTVSSNSVAALSINSDFLDADSVNSLDHTLNVAVSAISSAFGGSNDGSSALSGLLSNILGPNGVINSANIRSISRNIARANNPVSRADGCIESNDDDTIGFD